MRKFEEVKLYFIYQDKLESNKEFYTRVANEIQAMRCKIVSCDFRPEFCLIEYQNYYNENSK